MSILLGKRTHFWCLSFFIFCMCCGQATFGSSEEIDSSSKNEMLRCIKFFQDGPEGINVAELSLNNNLRRVYYVLQGIRMISQSEQASIDKAVLTILLKCLWCYIKDDFQLKHDGSSSCAILASYLVVTDRDLVEALDKAHEEAFYAEPKVEVFKELFEEVLSIVKNCVKDHYKIDEGHQQFGRKLIPIVLEVLKFLEEVDQRRSQEAAAAQPAASYAAAAFSAVPYPQSLPLNQRKMLRLAKD